MNADRINKQHELHLQENQNKLEEFSRAISDLTTQKQKLQHENLECSRSRDDLENTVKSFARIRQQLQVQIDEAKTQAEEDSRIKVALMQQIRNLNQDFEAAKLNAEEEVELRADLQKQLSKVRVDICLYLP